MKSARLIKRQEVTRPKTERLCPAEQRSTSVSNVETIRTWISRRRQQRAVNPRAEFAALFSRAA